MITHGHAFTENHSPTYNTWHTMKQRCLNPNNDGYPYYGGRGITICDRWLDFNNFLEDMGERPENMTLDRIDSNGNYCKENCKWSTKSEQSRNSANAVLTLEDAVDIAYRRITTGDSCRKIAADYGIAHSGVVNIGSRKKWPEAMDLALKRAAQDLKLKGTD